MSKVWVVSFSHFCIFKLSTTSLLLLEWKDCVHKCVCVCVCVYTYTYISWHLVYAHLKEPSLPQLQAPKRMGTALYVSIVSSHPTISYGSHYPRSFSPSMISSLTNLPAQSLLDQRMGHCPHTGEQHSTSRSITNQQATANISVELEFAIHAYYQTD